MIRKKLWILFFFILIINNQSLMLLADSDSVGFCMDPNALKVMKIAGTCVNIIKVLVPVILMVVSSVKLVKVIIEGTDTKEAINNILQKGLISVIIFFVPTIVGALMNYAKGYTSASEKFADCGICFSKSGSDDCKTLINTAKVKLDSRKKAEAEKREKERREASKKAEKEREARRQQNQNQNNTSPMPSEGGVTNALNMPYYNQASPAYANISLSGGRVYNTAGCGCGFTSLSMVIDGLTGQNNTPVGIINFFDPSSYADGFCAIYDETLVNSQIKTHFGVNYNVVFPRGNVPQTGAQAESRKQAIMNSLQSGHAIVLLIPGHYIALAGLNNGGVVVLDPGNSANNGTYSIDDLWNKYYNHRDRCNTQGKCGFVYAVEYSR